MTREEMWEEFENQLIRETRTSMTMSFDEAERMTKLGIKETVAKWKDRLEQESCEDAISRQEVLEQIYDWSKGEFLRTTNPFYYLRKRIKFLPQVNTQPKTGHWKWLQYDSNPKIGNYHCSECNFIPASFNLANKHLKYCPNCGTRMKESKEEEEKDDRFVNSERSEEAPKRDKKV